VEDRVSKPTAITVSRIIRDSVTTSAKPRFPAIPTDAVGVERSGLEVHECDEYPFEVRA
jgi:hypothetical protein